MKRCSLKSKDEIFLKAEEKTSKMKASLERRRMLKEQLARESKLTREDSLEILKEFEMLH
jgi:hypothetical protein